MLLSSSFFYFKDIGVVVKFSFLEWKLCIWNFGEPSEEVKLPNFTWNCVDRALIGWLIGCEWTFNISPGLQILVELLFLLTRRELNHYCLYPCSFFEDQYHNQFSLIFKKRSKFDTLGDDSDWVCLNLSIVVWLLTLKEYPIRIGF